MKIKIKNPVYGVPITIVDKVADDGFIHFSRNEEEMKFIVIGAYNYSKDIEGKSWNAKINSNYIYKRVLIQKYENSTNSN